jgi:hypothetical protein
VGAGCVHQHELGCDAACLGEERGALALVEMPVKVAAADTIEAAVREGEGERVALDERPRWDAARRDGEHALARVEPGHGTAKVLREEAGAARDVERPRRRERGENPGDGDQLLVEPGTLAIRVEPDPLVPIVVLRGALVVVGGGGGLAHAF